MKNHAELNVGEVWREMKERERNVEFPREESRPFPSHISFWTPPALNPWPEMHPDQGRPFFLLPRLRKRKKLPFSASTLSQALNLTLSLVQERSHKFWEINNKQVLQPTPGKKVWSSNGFSIIFMSGGRCQDVKSSCKIVLPLPCPVEGIGLLWERREESQS
jgi:hypothetical protein